MKMTAIKDDGMVYVDGRPMKVDMSDLPDFVHAVQWDENKGFLEFKPDKTGIRMPNITFNDLAPYKFLFDRWKMRSEHIQQEEQQALQRMEMEKEERLMKKAEIQKEKREPNTPAPRRKR